MAEASNKERRVVYGKRGDQLIFMPEERAMNLAGLYEALQSRTWGEFWEHIPDSEQSALMDYLQDFIKEDSFRIPDDKRSFEPDSIPGYSDGFWPAWPAQEMLEWVPKELQEQYGEDLASMHNGPFLRFDPEAEREVVSAFEERGYTCKKDADLIDRCYGEVD